MLNLNQITYYQVSPLKVVWVVGGSHTFILTSYSEGEYGEIFIKFCPAIAQTLQQSRLGMANLISANPSHLMT